MKKPYFESSYRFKILKSSWGIYAQIKAKVEPLNDSQYRGEYRISDLVWFTFNGKITAPQEDLSFILSGLKSVSQEIEKEIDETIIIVMTDFQIALCDCQKEGMFYAFAEWSAHHFGFTPKEINCFFDSEINQYVFPELK